MLLCLCTLSGNPRLQLAETDDTLGRTKSTIRSIGRRLMTDKLVQGIVILLELGIIGLVVWYRYYKK